MDTLITDTTDITPIKIKRYEKEYFIFFSIVV